MAPFRERNHIPGSVAAGNAGTAFGSMMYVCAVVTAGAARTAVLPAASPLLALPLSTMLPGANCLRRVGVGTMCHVAGIRLVVA